MDLILLSQLRAPTCVMPTQVSFIRKNPVKLDNKYINTATPGMAGIAVPTFYTVDMTLPVGVDSKECLWAAKPKIGEKDIIISSSTEESTKKFRIQIDDDGNISAIEVK